MHEFLDDANIGPTILKLFEGNNIRCAVAFWGIGAAEAFFQQTNNISDARLVCDISMGGSNPAALEALGAPKNPNIKHVVGLHAKVYLSDIGLIVGSANASNNGIGFSNPPQLIEAGSFHHPNTKIYDDACRWFETLWDLSSQVDLSALGSAREKWNSRPRNVVAIQRTPNPASLLDTVAARPDNFRGLGFAFSNAIANQHERTVAANGLIDNDINQLINAHEQNAIHNWNPSHLFDQRPQSDVLIWPMRFINAHQNPGGQVSYYIYKRAYSTLLENSGVVFGTLAGNLRETLGFAHSLTVMADEDQTRLQKIFENIIHTEQFFYRDGRALFQLMNDLEI